MDRLTEFLSDGDRPRLVRCLAVLDHMGGGPVRVADVESTAIEAGLREIKNWNVSQVLKRSNGAAVLVPDGWKVTNTGRKTLRAAGWQTQAQQIDHLVDDLNAAIARIPSEQRRVFLREAVSCYAAGHYRAAVVLSWSGAIAVMHDNVLERHLAQFNQEAIRQGTIKKAMATAGDLQEIKDHTFLQIAQGIGLIDKNQKQELEGRRQLRNACGHPSALNLRERMVAAHLESLILNVFDRL